MWQRQEFFDLVRQDALTFGPALGERIDALSSAMADDAYVVGFLVNLVFDDATGERTEWLAHILTDVTLIWVGTDHVGGADSKRLSSGAFTKVSARALGISRSPKDSDALHWIRNQEVRCDFAVGGGYCLFGGSSWHDQWGGNVTDLATEGAIALFMGLPRLAR